MQERFMRNVFLCSPAMILSAWDTFFVLLDHYFSSLPSVPCSPSRGNCSETQSKMGKQHYTTFCWSLIKLAKDGEPVWTSEWPGKKAATTFFFFFLNPILTELTNFVFGWNVVRPKPPSAGTKRETPQMFTNIQRRLHPLLLLLPFSTDFQLI